MVVTSFSAGLVTAGAGVISGERRAYSIYFAYVFIIRGAVKCYFRTQLDSGQCGYMGSSVCAPWRERKRSTFPLRYRRPLF
jgi:hypothetical protein